jgi:hypothetical protein
MNNMTITASREISAAWSDGFLTALDAAGVPEAKRPQLLADAMPDGVRNGLVRAEIEDAINGMVAKGLLVRMTDGRLIEADRYDPVFHAPKDELDD